MKKILIVLTIFITLTFGATYTTTQAWDHVGEEATVCGVVVSGYYAKHSRGKPTFLNLDQPYPNQKFTIVIWGENRDAFHTPEQRYKGKKVCVTGYIESFREIPQITVDSPLQIKKKP